MIMKYLVRQNFKNARVYYKVGQIWQSDDDVIAGQLIKLGLIETCPLDETFQTEKGGEILSSPPNLDRELDSEMGEDLGGYDDDEKIELPVAVKKPRKPRKKKE
jgi:hypothetical protein